MIENLCFQGGGVRGAAYAGAMQVLDERGLLSGIRRIAGTSAGAITAALMACGCGAQGLTDAILDTNFGSFLDGRGGVVGDAIRLMSHYGMHDGDVFEDVLREYVTRGCGDAEITFEGLAREAASRPGEFSELFVITSNLNKQRAEVLCAQTHPKMRVVEAVRCSMSIPIVFEPHEHGGDLFVDGGLSWNYPIDLFDHAHPASAEPRRQGAESGAVITAPTLGFALQPEPGASPDGFWSPEVAKIDTFGSMLRALVNFMYQSANMVHLHDVDIARTVFIDDLGVSDMAFDAPRDVIEKLVASGRAATSRYCDEHRLG